ncbi:Paf1-complex subunit LEO1 [Aspergillus candidus]|uniref:Leo1-like protein-domain-containing protein n=1 Tax=Aspergillus candidus TaxID=41067 RepID=A0A2I2F1V1_ASPCN|nr:Leo1-like protein-domain-containing protein [Aspergillus candidus]PLB34610.1 Leo1-like protein-domain-containing protein [Aspergillus candidus]
MSSSDEGVVRRPARGPGAGHQPPSPSGSERSNGPAARDQSPMGSDAPNMNGDDDDADLFGSEGSDAGMDHDRPQRSLDDQELDSADDEDRYDRTGDRMDYEGAEDEYQETVNIMDLSLGRAPEPLTSKDEVYTMPVPGFLSVETEEFNPETYVAPPYATAATSLCWRHDPNDDSLLQSNARIVRWEDGSMTLQLASAPKEQYRISTKPLAPLNKSGDYDTKLDSHVYLGAAAEASSVFRLTSHLTHGLTVNPTTMETDDAVQRLQESLAAATRGGKKTVDGSAPVIDVKEDPELAKRQAEMAEREKLKAARRRQQLADRELDRGRRVGVSHRSGGAGLTVGGLEDDDGLMTTRAKKTRRPNRRGEIYTDDEEDYDRRGRTREDEYDEDDGFLVGSDEEPEVADDDDDEDVLEDDDMDAEGEEERAPAARPKQRASPEGAAGTPPARKKHRYIVDDDDEE